MNADDAELENVLWMLCQMTFELEHTPAVTLGGVSITMRTIAQLGASLSAGLVSGIVRYGL